jgi:hypothetical protein
VLYLISVLFLGFGYTVTFVWLVIEMTDYMHLGGIITVDCSFTIQKLIMKTIAVADYINQLSSTAY